MKRRLRLPRRWRHITLRCRLALIVALTALVPLSAGAVTAVHALRPYLLQEGLTYTRGEWAQAFAGDGSVTGTVVAERLRKNPRFTLRKVTTSYPPERGALSLWPWTDPESTRPVPVAEIYHDPAKGGVPDWWVYNRLAHEQRLLNTVGWSLAGAVVLISATSAGVTWAVAGRVLRPVGAIRSRFAELTAHDLNQRVPVPDSDDEVGRLARTMNGTLERLQQSVEKQRRFVADASHELRTPLAALRAELEIALAQPGRADWQDVVAGALGDTERLQQLVSDLLLLARLDFEGEGEGEGQRQARPVDLVALVGEEVARRRPPARLTVTLSVPPGDVTVTGHPGLLRRVVGNLVDNAERHAAGSVAVTLAVDTTETHALISVEDDGAGIPVADRERVFERFTRLDESRTRDSGGTGLGLAIVRHITTLHRGSVDITDSRAGARFLVRIPLANRPAAR
ncbi:HAMP domain-containing histidine kinase [Streptomyces bambusae]|uniref:HAMP domain-containing sensor histidine kinase n=1 Tax=Streptomyces bambusae TaxID=1550616 RepID=UPI001CFD8C50|nr:HAMP domain-containing sensor histidine kinase [Streptomyces bambusae]MCB5164950.1 HAMP domain-containing histidine kinase [Streptomyces bambusae]